MEEEEQTTATGQAVSPQSQAIQTTVGGLVNVPQLPTGATVQPQLQQLGVGETMSQGAVTPTAPTMAPTTQVTTAVAPTTTTAPSQTIGAVTPTTAQTFQADTTLNQAAQAQAQQLQQLSQPAQGASGTITSEATVQGQLASITQDIESALASGTQLPAFARGAQKMALAAMAQRGLSASTIAADAVAEGVLRASTQIAAADAATYKQMIFQNLSNNQQAAMTNAQNYFQLDMQNLSNRQQIELANTQIRQQSLLSDQAAVNASRQFNATNQQQTDQFFSNLNTQISESNAKRFDSMEQFSSAEANKLAALNANNANAVAEANAKRADTVNQFNATLQDQRDRFNADNQRIIDQSNVEWRRAINTANTAAVNAANQTNAANILGLSNYAVNALWQQWRDEASWANTSSENILNRNHNLAVAAMERAMTFDLMDEQQRGNLLSMIGEFAVDLWNASAEEEGE